MKKLKEILFLSDKGYTDLKKARVYKRASSPLCFLCVYVAFSSQQTTRTHWRK